tara:strand:+ start:1614 stop:2000 length:387 start_codon:yes stop_codon:yes gene_type:complete
MFQIYKDEVRQGFRITFENGYAISVQFSKGNYCSNRNAETLDGTGTDGEIAVLYDDTIVDGFFKDSQWKWIKSSDDDVASYVSPNQLADVIRLLVTLPKPNDDEIWKNQDKYWKTRRIKIMYRENNDG